MIRNRSHAIGTANGRIQRVHPHSTSRTSGIEPERDSLGRRAPNKLTSMQREFRAIAKQIRQESRAAAMPVFFGPSQLTASGQIKQ